MATAGPPCTKTALETAIRQSNQDAHITSNKAFGCESGWAYAFALFGSRTQGFEGNLLFKANGMSWKVVSRATYCPKSEVPTHVKKAVCYSD